MATLTPDFNRIADSLLEQVKGFDYLVQARSVGSVVSVGDGIACAKPRPPAQRLRQKQPRSLLAIWLPAPAPVDGLPPSVKRAWHLKFQAW